MAFEIVSHTRYRSDWLLKPTRGAPFGLWYRDRAHAVSYAEWVAREVDAAEIQVFNRDGTLAESRVVGGAVRQGGMTVDKPARRQPRTFEEFSFGMEAQRAGAIRRL